MLRVPFHPQDFLIKQYEKKHPEGGRQVFSPSVSYLIVYFETKEGEKFDDRVQLVDECERVDQKVAAGGASMLSSQ